MTGQSAAGRESYVEDPASLWRLHWSGIPW